MTMIQRPKSSDYPEYYHRYVEKVAETGYLDFLNSSRAGKLLESLDDAQWNHRYASDKWNIKEVLVHLMDTERIFAYRALRISRNDKTPLAGFDQNAYFPSCQAAGRSAASLVDEYKATRLATIALFSNLTEEQLNCRGTASGGEVTVLALGYMIAGHELHHLAILEDKYLS